MTKNIGTINKRIIKVLITVSFMFLSIIVYLTCFELFMKDKILDNPYNQRNWEKEDNTIRGSIYDRNKVLLAGNEQSGDKYKRVYPYGALYSQIIGYNSRTYGRSMLEAKYNDYLLNIDELSDLKQKGNVFEGLKNYGNNLQLSIDHELQKYAYERMGDIKGAVVALNPTTGEVLAMVSKPDFDPNNDQLSKNWSAMVESADHKFVARAVQGLYAPGSTFKVITAAAAYENGLQDMTLNDQGSIVIEGRKINNYGGRALGPLDMKSALAYSSNVYFAKLGTELGENNLKNITDRFWFNKSLDFDLTVSKSEFPYENMSKVDMANAAFGQGKVLVTPLQMAMIASCIANNGIMMKPVLITEITAHDGTTVLSRSPEILSNALSSEVANNVKELMKGVVEWGTGTSASIEGVSVAGKTGTAENEVSAGGGGKEHAWFIGFAPADNPKIAIAVIAEYNGNTGGTVAAPIARDIMAAWIARNP